MTRLASVTLSLLAALACRGEQPGEPGMIDVRWTGADTGRLQVPAVARWCANDSVIEISGSRGDSGVAVALLPGDSVSIGVFPVGMPLARRSRPGARVALRWSGETLIEGYYSLSGIVTVDSGAELNGSLQATLTNVNDRGQITLDGTFHDLSLRQGSAEACGIVNPNAPDSVAE
jgi:hypothetical protein